MKRREINIFNISFLDLISGALGAVVLLFIIVPKLDSKAQDSLEALNELNVQVEQLDDLLENAKNNIPKELYEEIEAQIDALKNTIADLEDSVAELQEELDKCKERIQQLENQITELTEQNTAQQQEINDLNKKVSELEQKAERIEGSARFVIVTLGWDTIGDDVDLHVIDPSGNEFFWDKTTITGVPGELTKDEREGPGFEVFKVTAAKPGRYQIKARLYKSVSGQAPVIDTWVYHRNGSKQLASVTLNKVKQFFPVSSFIISADGSLTFE